MSPTELAEIELRHIRAKSAAAVKRKQSRLAKAKAAIIAQECSKEEPPTGEVAETALPDWF